MAEAPASDGRDARVARHRRFLIPLATLVTIGALVILVGGGGRPNASGSPNPAGPVHAELTVNARDLEWPCSPGGCEMYLDLSGPGGRWTSKLADAELGSLRRLDPRLPPLLADGEWTLRAEVHVIGDVIYPGENAPRDYGVATKCTSTFTIAPETTIAVATLDFWTGLCAAGTTVAADPRDLASLAVFPSLDAGCGADVGGCDYYLKVLGPGGTWRAVVQTVKPRDQLLTNDLVSMLAPGTYRLDAESHRRGPEREFGAGFQEDLGVFSSCSGEFVVPEAPEPGTASIVDASITFRGPTCSVQTELRSSPISTGSPGVVAPVPTRSGS